MDIKANHTVLSWQMFLKEINNIDCVWLGETHGIKNNYRAYKYLIKKLIPFGFHTVALEMPEEFERYSSQKFIKYADIIDGRFSHDSFKFFEWLGSLRDIKAICFDVRTDNASQKETEKQMANNLLSKILRNQKLLVFTGSFHSEVEKQQDTLPMAGIIKRKLEDRMTVVEFKYDGGLYYNFGLKKIYGNLFHYDNKHLPFGTITKNRSKTVSSKYFMHLGVAKPISLLNNMRSGI